MVVGFDQTTIFIFDRSIFIWELHTDTQLVPRVIFCSS
jgi:hypothetical protein